ncbi:MAG: hypothetical protein RQ753_04010 [Desulfurivibrionaceae bacterium]|nr:hypothetical protein [Desulfurivibrionaceae bacterium]
MKLISEQKLDNSLLVKVIDQSRRVAVDRWYVKVVCEVKLLLTDGHFAMCPADDDPERLSAIRQLLGDAIVMEIVQERNFVDEAARDKVRQDLVNRLSENISDYLASDSFPARFFAIRYRQAEKLRRMETAPPRDQFNEVEDDGPADFSACFRD